MNGAPGGTDVVAWQHLARAFTEREVLPVAAAMDRSDRMPEGIRPALGASGFLGLSTPTEYGGTAGSAQTIAAVLAELARGSAAVATLLSVHLSVAAAPIVTWGTDAQKARYLPNLARGTWLGAFALTEAGAGSDSAQVQARYRTEDGGYRLDGTKMFITNGGLADLILTFATRDPSLGKGGMSAFVLAPPRGAGFSVAQRLDKLGLHGSETTELVYDGLHVPTDARLGPEGEGLRVALRALTDGRVGIAACALGVAEAALELLVEAGKAHVDEAAQRTVARAFTDVLAARTLVEHAAALKDRGAPFVAAASAAKLWAARAAVRTANTAFEAVGPAAGERSARAGRLFRDARVFPIVEGTSEIQELILGRSLVGR